MYRSQVPKFIAPTKFIQNNTEKEDIVDITIFIKYSVNEMPRRHQLNIYIIYKNTKKNINKLMNTSHIKFIIRSYTHALGGIF